MSLVFFSVPSVALAMRSVVLLCKHASKANYIEKIAKYRLAAQKFLVYGRLVKQATLTPTPKLIRVKCTESRSYTLETPAVQAYLWETPDGSMGLFCANLMNESQNITANFTLGNETWLCSKIDENGKGESIPETYSGKVSLLLELGPYEIRVFEFDRQSK
ncbi:MAG: hypothetical protein JXA11_02355 [Phycisphaerae bacterium]|nr:hypothetical protein [Phycisphaerae bacterium]